VDEVLSDIQHALKGADVVKLSADAQSTMSQFSGAATRLNGLIERLQGDKGVIARVERASSAVGDVAYGATGIGRDLEATMRDVQEAAIAVQKLGDALDRDSDMLLKGRTRSTR